MAPIRNASAERDGSRGRRRRAAGEGAVAAGEREPRSPQRSGPQGHRTTTGVGRSKVQAAQNDRRFLLHNGEAPIPDPVQQGTSRDKLTVCFAHLMRPGGPERDSAIHGKAEGEAGSVGGRVAGEIAVVLVGDAAGDGEAETMAGFAGVESHEALEDALALAFGYAGPVIRDERLDVSVEPS